MLEVTAHHSAMNDAMNPALRMFGTAVQLVTDIPHLYFQTWLLVECPVTGGTAASRLVNFNTITEQLETGY